MAISFLAAVNETAKQVKIVQGSSGELTTFTDSARQSEIDVLLRSWNDAIDELYKVEALQGEQAESTITLVLDTREYSLASDFIQMVGDPIDETDGFYLREYSGGYEKMRLDQLQPSDFDGRPNFWCINPTTGDLRVDTNPQSAEVGAVYKYLYEKRINLTATTDTFPFNDDVVDALQDAVSEIWQRKRRRQFDETIYQSSMSRAMSFLRPTRLRRSYGLAASRQS